MEPNGSARIGSPPLLPLVAASSSAWSSLLRARTPSIALCIASGISSEAASRYRLPLTRGPGRGERRRRSTGESRCRRMKNVELTSVGRRENPQSGTEGGTADGELRIRRSIRTLHKNDCGAAFPVTGLLLPFLSQWLTCALVFCASSIRTSSSARRSISSRCDSVNALSKHVTCFAWYIWLHK